MSSEPMPPTQPADGPTHGTGCGHVQRPAVPPGAAGPWGCPMHPEVLEAQSGTCPECGMALEPLGAPLADGRDDPELALMQRRLVVAVLLTAPILVLTMGGMLPGRPFGDFPESRTGTWIQLLLTAPVVLWCGWPFLVRARESIARRRFNMFTQLLGHLLGHHALVVLELLDPGLAGEDRLPLRDEVVAGEPGLHVHEVARLSQIGDVLAQDELYLGHRCPS